MNDKHSKNWLLVSDVDDTLLGDDHALSRLVDALGKVRDRFLLAYNSSRPCASLRKSLAEHSGLPEPDYLIGALGTEIQQVNSGETIGEHARQFKRGWRREEIAALMKGLGLVAHEDQYQTPFKASYHVPDHSHYMSALELLHSSGLKAKVIFSGETNLDIIPEAAGKDTAIEFLCRMLSFDADQVIVAGDSANDRDMFLHEFKGIIVANADAQLKSLSGPRIFHAQNGHADGVLEGLQYWGALSPRINENRR